MRGDIRERGDNHQSQVLVLGLMGGGLLCFHPCTSWIDVPRAVCKVLLREGRQGHNNQRDAWPDSCHLLKGHSVCVWHTALPVPTRPRPAGTRASELRTAVQPGAWAPGHTRRRPQSPAPPTQAPPPILFISVGWEMLRLLAPLPFSLF